MTSQRDRIQMPAGEARRFLEEGRHLQVASIGPSGAPHLVAMWYVVDDQGRVLFTTYGRSQKVQNVRRDPRVTLLVEAGEAYNEQRGVMVEGRAEVLSEPAFTAQVMRQVGAKYGSGSGASREAQSEIIPPAAHKRAVVRVTPERMRSWDHRRL
ncbi:MAG: TIGR03618 family F420-dependent PPOX class oxidoreductase [Dehalococcoidia bacterium]